MNLSGKKVLMVLAPKDFRDEEYLKPREVFEKAGFKVEVASLGVKQATGAYGATTKVDYDLKDVEATDYEAVVFVGGAGSSIYFDNETAKDLAKTAFGQGKVVAAICIAPSILANAGLLQGRRATCFSSQADNLRARGTVYTDESVTVDGKIVTANGPQAAFDFGQMVAKLLSD